MIDCPRAANASNLVKGDSISETIDAPQLTSIIDLPDELIAKVLKYLGDGAKWTRLVCRKFDRSFARYSFSAQLQWPGNPAEFAYLLSDRFSNLKSLKIVGPWFCFPVVRLQSMPLYTELHTCELIDAQGIRDREFRQICMLPNIQSLRLDRAKVTERQLCDLIERQRGLTALSLAGNSITGLELTARPGQFLHLKSLDLRGSEHLVDQGLEEILARCPKLKRLQLADCHQLSNRTFRSLMPLQAD